MVKKLFKLLMGLLVVVLVVGIIVGVVYCGKDKSPKPDSDTDSGTIAAISDKGVKIYAGGTYSMPEQLTIVADAPKPDEYSSVGEFILTVSFSDATVNSVYDFTLSFMDVEDLGWYDYLRPGFEESEKFKDPSNYIHLTPMSSNTVKVNFLKQFCLPIEINAQVLGSRAHVTCRVDCISLDQYNNLPEMVKSYFGELTGKQYPYYMMQESDCNTAPLDFGNTGKFGSISYYNHLNGTVAPAFLIRDCTLALKPEFVTRLISHLKFDISFKAHNVKASISSSYYRDLGDDGSYKIDAYEFEIGILDYSMFIENYKNFNTQQKHAIYQAWYAAFQESDNADNIEIQINQAQIVYSGVVLKEYSTYIDNFISTMYASVSGERYGNTTEVRS